MKKLLEELRSKMERDAYEHYTAVIEILGLTQTGTLILSEEVDYDKYNQYLQNCEQTYYIRGRSDKFAIFRSMWEFTVLFTKYDHPRITIVLDHGIAQDEYILAHIRSEIFGENNYSYKPKTNEELKDLIDNLIKERGINADLNDIDTSLITDMSCIFWSSEFNGDISKWDVSNVTNMFSMFYDSDFNGNILNWDVSNVKNMGGMFWNSKFNSDISRWNVSNVIDMHAMFATSKFNKDISNWDVSNVKDMGHMFRGSEFNGDISGWDVSNVENMDRMFRKSEFKGDISNWNVLNVVDMIDMFNESALKGKEPNWYHNKNNY